MCGRRMPSDVIEAHTNAHFDGEAAAERPKPQQPPQRSSAAFCVSERVTERIARLIATRPLRTNPVTDSVVASRVSHFATMPEDSGWGCGFRNIQMLLSALFAAEPFRSHLATRLPGDGARVPTIFELQAVLDDAWARGHDREGARQLGNSVLGTKRWIGAVECATLLGSLGVRCAVTDFDGENAADRMVAWCWRHFAAARRGLVLPVYLQQRGHSRTVVGAEVRRDGSVVLLLLDPSLSRSELQRALYVDEDLRLFRRTLRSFRKPQYQICSVSGLLP